MGTLARDHAATIAYADTLWSAILAARSALAHLADEEARGGDHVLIGDVLARAEERRACFASLAHAEEQIALLRATTPLRELGIRLRARNAKLLGAASSDP